MFVGDTSFLLTIFAGGLQFSFRRGSSIMKRMISSAISVTSLFEVNRLATGQIPHD
ncbi:fur leader peptide domain protein [Citrobacter koseri]|nr:hypothetical protein [Citrobacter koseri]KXA02325.1 fur leader peptide domain protein [Citrobacter koseri]KXA05962.1 fur leader peptide domain protein [Citrobacter koseri]KXB47324.1 fur leader peptide domain protein [Citrobacter koseri]MBL4563181.1 hypothetical protein [Citrobacter koseri]